MTDKLNSHFETRSIHAGLKVDAERSRALPLHRTAAYVFHTAKQASDLFGLRELGNIYSRLTNPTVSALEDRIASLEGGAAGVALASGTAAIHYTILNLAKTGDEIVSSRTLYGGSFSMFDAILPDQGITTRFVDIHKPEEIEAAINEHTRLVFLETIGNPALDVPDLAQVAAIAHRHHLPLVVDNTFATPFLFRPLEHGADIVIESLTKWISGHGTVLGGIVVEKGGFEWTDTRFSLFNEPDRGYHGLRFAHDLGPLLPIAFSIRLRTIPLRNLGATLSPDNAWQILQGVETLALRLERHSENALQVARYLQGHPRVGWVRYPGLPEDPFHGNAKAQFENGYGGVVVFGIRDAADAHGAEAGARFIERLRLFSDVANVGDAKSLAIHPASTTHSQLGTADLLQAGITPDLIRLSVGLEHIDDILADLEQALR